MVTGVRLPKCLIGVPPCIFMKPTEISASSGITRRGFVKGGMLLLAGLVIGRVERVFGETAKVGTGQRIGNAGAVSIKPSGGWPWAPSFTRYSGRARFSDFSEAAKRIRSRQFPVELRRQ